MGCFRTLMVGGIAVLGLAACAPAAPPLSPAPAPAAPGGAPAAPAGAQRGGVLQYAPIKGGQTLHPHRGGNTDILRHVGPAYETLVNFKYEATKSYRENPEIIPWLAESWQQPNDLTYVFKIRQGVKWHDGTPFTAEDVAFTYNWLRQEKATASARVAQAESFEVLDPHTLKITLKKPVPDFLEDLAEKNLLIVAKHAVERGDDLNKVINGTGPFKMKSFRTGIESVWERFDGYWQPGRPYMDGVRQIWGLEDSAMMAAFVAAENDLLAVGDMTQLETVRQQRPDSGFFTKANDIGIGMLMKLDAPPFNDLRVRRAVHLAIDREAMNLTLAKGRGMHLTPGVWPGLTGWAMPQEELRKLPGYRTPKDQDLAEAKRLLAEAGYPQGFAFEIIYNAGGIAPRRITEMIPAQLKAIGVTANLKPLESGVYNQTDLSTGAWEGGNVPTIVNAQFRGLYDRFHSKAPSNKVGLNDPKLDGLIDAVLTGKDVETRQRATRQLQEHFLDQVYYIPTIEQVDGALWQPWVHDFSFNGTNALSMHEDTYSQMWLDREAIPSGRR